MRKITQSRQGELQIDECVAQSGFDRYTLTIAAAGRAREISRAAQRNGDFRYVNATMSALIDLQHGLTD